MKANILDQLLPLAVPIDTLTLDAANARQHPQKNLEAIKASLERFGQRKPIVVQRAGSIVRAGNGTLIAARALGWTEIAAVIVDDDSATAAQFAIADNRSGELSEWDADGLALLLHGLNEAEQESIGFAAGDVDDLMADLNRGLEEEATPIASVSESAAATPITIDRDGSIIPPTGLPPSQLQAGLAQFRPVEPTIDLSPHATAETVKLAASQMERQFQSVQVTREVNCPECGHLFQIGG